MFMCLIEKPRHKDRGFFAIACKDQYFNFNSTLLFFALPCAVLLLAMGLASPKPDEESLFWPILPFVVR